MSGHNKWSTIKRKKEAKDKLKGASFTKLIKLISVAVKTGGGPDMEANFKLKLAVDKARQSSMPNANIQSAIKKASGKDEDGNLVETITYEGYGPAGVAVIVDALTDNRNRTAAEVRHLFSKHGGNLGETGCVGWMFELKGRFFISCKPAAQEELSLKLMEFTVEDIRNLEDGLEVLTSIDDFYPVKAEFEKAGIEVEEAEPTKLPKNLVSAPDTKSATQVLKLIDELEEDEDVEAVFTNLTISDEIAQTLE